MNASRTDQPRTRPVALRTKTACSTPSPPAATDAISPTSSSGCLTARQHEPLDLLLAVHLYYPTEKLPLLVGAAGVDAQRLPEPVRAAGLVDVAVQRERRLVALDRLAHGRRPDGDRGAPRVLEVHLGGELRRIVEAGPVRRAVQAEDRALGRRGHLGEHRLD